MKRLRLLGINVDSIAPVEAYAKILKLSESSRPSHVVFLDTPLLIKSLFSRDLRYYINNADIVLPASAGIKNGLRFLNKNVETVYNYFSFLISLLLNFTDKKKFIYLLGKDKQVIDKADKNIRDSFPGIRIVGKYHTQYKKDFENDLITAIRKATPALILLGTKSPHQEKWIYRRKKYFNTGVFIGVGDFIRIVGGKGKSPTDKMIRSGFYGFVKFLKNPFRFYRIIYYIIYVFMLLIYKISGK